MGGRKRGCQEGFDQKADALYVVLIQGKKKQVESLQLSMIYCFSKTLMITFL